MSFNENIPSITIISIGRDKENDVVIENPHVSRQHAKLTVCSLTSFIIEDSGSKRGIFIENEGELTRISRKLIDIQDKIWLADVEITVKDLLPKVKSVSQSQPKLEKDPLDFTVQFKALQKVYEDYPVLRKACRDRDKMIRLWSVVGGSVIGVGTVATAGAFGILAMLSSAGLSILIPTLSSHLLSTDEKLELIEKEYRQQYRCPNPNCRDPFGNREYELLVNQKKCGKCKATWVK
jgi:pSer/pThr/pTyr-binding forkhead associated (FHA) protein